MANDALGVVWTPYVHWQPLKAKVHSEEHSLPEGMADRAPWLYMDFQAFVVELPGIEDYLVWTCGRT